jgi:hypothetical protein
MPVVWLKLAYHIGWQLCGCHYPTASDVRYVAAISYSIGCQLCVCYYTTVLNANCVAAISIQYRITDVCLPLPYSIGCQFFGCH